MDSVTQAVLGAAIGEVVLGKKIGKKGAILGAVVATVPDLDVIFYLFYDKMEMLSIHRGYSHSLLINFVLAILVAFVLTKFRLFNGIRFIRLLLFTSLCLTTHILLDSFTAYGTQLFLPFSNMRFGFDSMNVVDPLYTIPLIIGLVLSVWSQRAIYNKAGLIVSSLYLIFTLLNKQVVVFNISERFENENIAFSSLLTIPVGMANIN